MFEGDPGGPGDTTGVGGKDTARSGGRAEWGGRWSWRWPQRTSSPGSKDEERLPTRRAQARSTSPTRQGVSTVSERLRRLLTCAKESPTGRECPASAGAEQAEAAHYLQVRWGYVRKTRMYELREKRRRDYTNIFRGCRRDLWQGRAVRDRKSFARAGYSGWTRLTFDRLTVTCLDSHPLPRLVTDHLRQPLDWR